MISYITDDDPPLLLCPYCRGDYLHHDRVEVFERREDAEDGLHVDVRSIDTLARGTQASISIDRLLGGNPSSRRHGLSIEFWCEFCHGRSALTVAQHKGQTEIQFSGISKGTE